MEKVNLDEKFAKITEYWKPYVAGELNGQLVKLDKLKGEFVWHHHDREDELFFVVKGRLLMQVREKPESQRNIWVEEGELVIIPHGVEHRPVAEEETHLGIFVPAVEVSAGMPCWFNSRASNSPSHKTSACGSASRTVSG